VCWRIEDYRKITEDKNRADIHNNGLKLKRESDINNVNVVNRRLVNRLTVKVNNHWC